MKRQRPPNRLSTECVRLARRGMELFVHTDRPLEAGPALGPVTQVQITVKGHVGSEWYELCADLTRYLNRELQIRRKE